MPSTNMERNRTSGRIRSYLEQAPPGLFVGYAIVAAFLTYFCMYAFRKPFAAAKFEGVGFFGTAVALKTAFVISQIIGYTLSKYIGIKVCSEVTATTRARTLLKLILCAEAALLLFAILPGSWKFLAMILNGLPLGMVWGLVVAYLEGRRTSELLLAGLSCSYIVSSGVLKDLGRATMEGGVASLWGGLPVIGPAIASRLSHVSEWWMPALVGLHFLPLFALSVWMLDQLPRPSEQDKKERVERQPMKQADRMSFVRQFFAGLLMLLVAYFFLTAYRDYRDNYQVEVLEAMGFAYKDNKAIITKTETLVMFGVMAALAALNTVRENRRGLICTYAIMTSGMALLGISTLMLDLGWISGFWWMTLTGLGSYLAYVPYGSVLFDRLIASTRVTGTAVFAIYLADAIGYTGSVGVQLYKDLVAGEMTRLSFFKSFTYGMSVVGVACLIPSCIYFLRKSKDKLEVGSPSIPR